jgi:hypothetical protein
MDLGWFGNQIPEIGSLYIQAPVLQSPLGIVYSGCHWRRNLAEA